MTEQGQITTFMTTVANMPHIAASIMCHLDVNDIVSCLRTCHAFRSFVSCALNDNNKLKKKLDRAATGKAASIGHLWTSAKSVLIPVLSLDNDTRSASYAADPFGLDGYFWINSGLWQLSSRGTMPVVNAALDIFDFWGNRVKNIPFEHMPKVEVLANGKVLVDDGFEAKVISCSEGLTKTEVVLRRQHKKYYLRVEENPYELTQPQGQEGRLLTMFNGQDGLPNTIRLDVCLDKASKYFYRKVNQ